MGKHKKFLKSEKAKVKLKDRKLPKGLNVTKTEFKVRKIVLREQLHETVLEEGKRKQSVKVNEARLQFLIKILLANSSSSLPRVF